MNEKDKKIKKYRWVYLTFLIILTIYVGALVSNIAVNKIENLEMKNNTLQEHNQNLEEYSTQLNTNYQQLQNSYFKLSRDYKSLQKEMIDLQYSYLEEQKKMSLNRNENLFLLTLGDDVYHKLQAVKFIVDNARN
jgi:uncharacterized membrane-anchored protein YhcB (DUF1043 family)